MGRVRVTSGITVLALAVAMLSPGVGSGVGAGGSDGAPKSAAARAALRTYDDAITAARQAYARDADAAKEAATGELGEALKAATRAADLDEANRIKATIEQIAGDDTQVGGEPLGARAGKSPKGTWEARFLNGNRHVYEFDGRGGLRSSLDGRVWKGRVRREGRDLVCVFDGDDALQRFSFAGDRIFVEYFRPADRYPRETATDIATGLPVQPGRGVK